MYVVYSGITVLGNSRIANVIKRLKSKKYFKARSGWMERTTVYKSGVMLAPLPAPLMGPR